MSFADPTQTPPEEPDEYTFSTFMGCLIVDGVIQCGMAFWFKWIYEALTDFNFNVWLFWLGLTILFVTLHWYDKHKAAVGILYQVLFFIIASIITVIVI